MLAEKKKEKLTVSQKRLYAPKKNYGKTEKS